MSSAVSSMILAMFGMFALCFVMLIIVIRVVSRNKILCTFHKNHKKGSLLLKYDNIDQCVWIGREDDPNREKYQVIGDCIEWVDWPGGIPSFFCVPIRSLDYVRNVEIPIHPEKRVSSSRSARMNRLQSDTNVLQAVYLHAKQSLGLGKKQTASTMVLILLITIAVLSLVGAWKGMSTSSDIKSIRTDIHNVSNALGVGTNPVVTPVPSEVE